MLKTKNYRHLLLVLSCSLASLAFASTQSTEHTNSTYAKYPKVDYGTGPKATIIKRGEYLTKIGDCIACHSNTQNGGAAFAGGLAINTPYGKVYAPNITPDKKTGIGQWTAENFYKAMTQGVAPDGSHYFPVFPYLYFSKMTKDDIMAMWAYFQAIPAVENEVKVNELSFPYNIRALQSVWKWLYFDKQPLRFVDHRGATWNRGNYIVNGLGHCSMCHTPINSLGAPKTKYFLTGAFVEGYWAPNITSYGLENATNQDLMRIFREDILMNDAGKVTGPMRQVNHDSLRHLTDNDIIAIATYLQTVKVARPYYVRPAKEVSLARGKYIYQRACVACHQEGEMGSPVIGNNRTWFERVRDKGITKLYRHTIHGFNQMPVRGGCVECSDEDVVSAVDYLIHKALTEQQKRQLKNPTPKKKPTIADGEAVYKMQCAGCHDMGRLGAPILGDKKVWKHIIKQNMDVLIANKMEGTDRYPPKGGCRYCTTSEVIAAIKYMVNESKSKGDYSLW